MHFTDLEAFLDCSQILIERPGLYGVIPEFPHIANVPRGLSIQDLENHFPVIKKLVCENRLFTYHGSNGKWFWKNSTPTIELRYFSAEPGLQIAAFLGAETVFTLGIDGGSVYSSRLSSQAQGRRLTNGQKSFDIQWSQVKEIQALLGIEVVNLEPLPKVFVGASLREVIPYLVLKHSIEQRASKPVMVVKLPEVPRSLVRGIKQGTRFSLARFRIPQLLDNPQKAVYLDSDMIVFDDIIQLLERDLRSSAIAVVNIDRPPLEWRDNERFRIGKQTSVMVLDTRVASWRLEDIVQQLRTGNLSYMDLMYELAFLDGTLVDDSIDPAWNSLEIYKEGETKLLHMTNVPTQPWRNKDSKHYALWINEFRAAIRTGAVQRQDVRDAVRRGDVIKDLLIVFDEEAQSILNLPKRSVCENQPGIRLSRVMTFCYRIESMSKNLLWRRWGRRRVRTIKQK